MGQWLTERASLTGGFGDGFTLFDRLLQQIARGHKFVFFTLLENADDLVDKRRHSTQRGQIVLVLFGGVERHKTDKLRDLQMGPEKLIDGHLKNVEVNACHPNLQVPEHEDLVESLLFREAG